MTRPTDGMPRPARTRVEAARLLRHARRRGRGAAEAIEWAFAAVPDSRGARRLMIGLLIRRGDHEAAEALIARAMLGRPTDAGLGLLRARSLHARGRHAEAAAELRLVMTRRPNHRRVLELAGRVALRTGDAYHAAACFRAIDTRTPSDRVKRLRVVALLRAKRPDLARGVLEQMDAPPLLLRARVLLGEGRLREAAETLDRERPAADHPDYAPVTCALIEVLEETADTRRLASVLEPLDVSQPPALERAGRAWLAIGSFETAIVRMAPLARIPGYRARALSVLLVAASMLDRRRLANRALERLRRLDEPIEPKRIAETWGRGLLGRMLRDQGDARDAGSDPQATRLDELLGEAARVLDQELEERGAELPAPRRVELETLGDTCRDLLGSARRPG